MRPALAAWLALSLLAGTGAEVMCEDPPATRTRSVPAPQLSAEEQLSPHMPEALRCDACHAVAFQVRGGETAPQNWSEGVLWPGEMHPAPLGQPADSCPRLHPGKALWRQRDPRPRAEALQLPGPRGSGADPIPAQERGDGDTTTLTDRFLPFFTPD